MQHAFDPSSSYEKKLVFVIILLKNISLHIFSNGMKIENITNVNLTLIFVSFAKVSEMYCIMHLGLARSNNEHPFMS